MADDYIQLPADGAGKKLDTATYVTGAGTVERQRTEDLNVAQLMEESLILLRMLLSGAAGTMPDSNDRVRVSIEAGTLPLVSTVALVSTVTTVTTVTKVNQFGAYVADGVPSNLMNGSAATLRDRIAVS